MECNPGPRTDGVEMPSVSDALHQFEAMVGDHHLAQRRQWTPSKDPLADGEMDDDTGDKDGPDVGPMVSVDLLKDFPSLGYLHEYRLDSPANVTYLTAFKGVMSTLRHFRFPGDT